MVLNPLRIGADVPRGDTPEPRSDVCEAAGQ
jgi:hypothetical protein